VSKFREIGRLRLPLTPRRFSSGGGVKTRGRSEATLLVGTGPEGVYLQIGFEEVALDVEARDQFARLWMEAERAAEAQAGATP
jgi:hypothetical protein